jgi:Fe-S-cluster containining protein
MMVGKNPCDGCDLCCRHVAVEIDTPETKKEYDQIRWFLLHKYVWIFIDNDDTWNMQVNTPCEKLDENGMCSYYKKRPMICREYSADCCERHGDGDSFKVMWKSIGEFESWILDGKIVPKNQSI